ncbi:MAG: hypothetical protein M8861_11140, partial [marine benthic group bacterium]|nr:hypothetical protein [Gemmatimonadota bacterium]
DEARGLRDDASEILASVVPRGSAPSFEQIRQRAGAEADEPPSSGSGTRGGPVRMGWLSPQRLGWAATIALALGAGWIGRAVLEEKGWTDPFHEGQVPAATGPAVDSEAARQDAADQFADDALGELESKEVRQRQDRLAETNEEPAKAAPDPEVEEAAPVELGAQGGVTRKEAPADIADELEVDADSRRRAEAPAAAEALVSEDRARESRAKSVRPPVDPWHSIPAVRVTPASDFAGCYRLEYSWSPEVGYLPGTVELTLTEPADRVGEFIFAIGIPGRAQSMLHEAIWATPAPDSVWLRLVTGEERAAFTVRAKRSEVNWVGEGRVWTPGAPVSAGQVRGTVSLMRTECEPS